MYVERTKERARNSFTCKGEIMGVFFLIALIVPLAIYYIIIVPLVKIGVINRIKNKRKKAIFFWLLMLFPIGDHIVGYVVYKALCFSVGGTHIYKTVSDVAEQRAYWFYEGLKATEYHGDDEEYKFLANNGLVRRNGKCLKPIKQEGKNYYSCKQEDIERVYLNYCNTQYDTLHKDDPNYHRSCKNANELIAQYQLENVIKVPKSSYSVSTSRTTLLPLLITIDSSRVIHTATKEKLGVNREITFYGGWWFNVAGSMFGHNKGWSFGTMFENDFKQKIISNPYKQQINQGIAK